MFNQRLSCYDQSHLQKGTLSKQSKPPTHNMFKKTTIHLYVSPSLLTFENTFYFLDRLNEKDQASATRQLRIQRGFGQTWRILRNIRKD